MKHRDDDIITEIFRTEQNNLYRLACYKIGDTELAADLVQDLFIKVLENPNKDEIKDLKSYLYQSLLNACVSIFRNTQNATTVPIDNNIIDDGCKQMALFSPYTPSVVCRTDNHGCLACRDCRLSLRLVGHCACCHTSIQQSFIGNVGGRKFHSYHNGTHPAARQFQLHRHRCAIRGTHIGGNTFRQPLSVEYQQGRTPRSVRRTGTIPMARRRGKSIHQSEQRKYNRNLQHFNKYKSTHGLRNGHGKAIG